MTEEVRWFAPALAALLAIAGCGGATSSAGTTQARAETEWTSAQLRKLDPELRPRVREGDRGRIPVKVYFHELPSESELSSLLLNRMGTQAIGAVEPDTLHRIASRADVEHIEEIQDVGYDDDVL
jgi:hypothetical protein